MKTFYQFNYVQGDGKPHRVSVISAGDSEEAREFLVDPKLGGLANVDVGLSPMVTHWVPDDMSVLPIDRCEMRTCWSSWRVTDWVYGFGDGRRQPDADGVMMTFDEIDGDVKRINLPMAVARRLMTKDATYTELCQLFAGKGLWFVGARVFAAVWRLGRTGRVTQSAFGVYRMEVRRA